ncbi:MAG: fumarate hydratase [Methanosarcinales archaeon]|nr:fumarate hydratase [Methanosarcinales archaeon]
MVQATLSAVHRAQTSLPPWVEDLIRQAEERERDPVARSQLQAILENVALARESRIPICQDTGLPVFHLQVGREARVDFDLQEAVADGVRLATEKVPLRPNVVDPLSRKNTGDNTGRGMPRLMVETVEGSGIRITAFPKGAGSENMSLVGMRNPADDPLDYVVQEVAKRAANACPPVFVGVGIGGTFDQAAALAKEALIRMPGTSDLDRGLLQRINSLGIGPMGLGGDTTALGVRVETACCHTASLPVAINMQCWANRMASSVVEEEGWSTD